MEFNINDTVYTIRHELDVLKGTVIDKIDEGSRFKYIVMFKLRTDDNKEYETSNVFYEWNLFGSEEECLQYEYNREKSYIENGEKYLKQIKEELEKIKEEKHTCKNCTYYCPHCNSCRFHNCFLDKDELDGCEEGYWIKE